MKMCVLIPKTVENLEQQEGGRRMHGPGRSRLGRAQTSVGDQSCDSCLQRYTGAELANALANLQSPIDPTQLPLKRQVQWGCLAILVRVWCCWFTLFANAELLARIFVWSAGHMQSLPQRSDTHR